MEAVVRRNFSGRRVFRLYASSSDDDGDDDDDEGKNDDETYDADDEEDQRSAARRAEVLKVTSVDRIGRERLLGVDARKRYHESRFHYHVSSHGFAYGFMTAFPPFLPLFDQPAFRQTIGTKDAFSMSAA